VVATVAFQAGGVETFKLWVLPRSAGFGAEKKGLGGIFRVHTTKKKKKVNQRVTRETRQGSYAESYSTVRYAGRCEAHAESPANANAGANI
jgi:hypothetical protein